MSQSMTQTELKGSFRQARGMNVNFNEIVSKLKTKDGLITLRNVQKTFQEMGYLQHLPSIESIIKIDGSVIDYGLKSDQEKGAKLLATICAYLTYSK